LLRAKNSTTTLLVGTSSPKRSLDLGEDLLSWDQLDATFLELTQTQTAR
jgi:hypothetical protein